MGPDRSGNGSCKNGPGFSGGALGRRLHGRYQVSRQPAVLSDAAILPVSAFRDMNGVGKLSSVKTGTSATVVVNRQNLHLKSRILGCMGSGESHQVSLVKKEGPR